MTYEISFEANGGADVHSTTKNFPSEKKMKAWVKEFAADWWRGAQYSAFCLETEEFFQGKAN